MKHTLRLQLQAMAESEGREMLDAGMIDRIKAAGDSKPLIKVFSIGHEGIATPNAFLPGGGSKAQISIQFLKDAVRKVGEKLRIGTPAVHLHNEDNSLDGRPTVGQVVGKKLKEIGGVLHSLAAVHIFPAFRDVKLDVASFESNGNFEVEDGQAKLTDLENISALALSDGDIDRPAFVDATLRMAFQCFAETLTDPKKGDRTMPITLQEIQDAIVEDPKLTPSAIFGESALLTDVVVAARFKAAETKNQTSYERMKNTSTKADERLLKKDEMIAKLEGEVSDLSASNRLAKADVFFGKVADERKLNEKQVAYIKEDLSKFKTEAKDDAGFTKDMDEFVEKGMADFEVKAKLFGVTIDKKDDANDGAGAPEGNENLGDKTDLSDPKNNDLIPTLEEGK